MRKTNKLVAAAAAAGAMTMLPAFGASAETSPLVCSTETYEILAAPSGNSFHLADGYDAKRYIIKYGVNVETGAVLTSVNGWDDKPTTQCEWVSPGGTTYRFEGDFN